MKVDFEWKKDFSTLVSEENRRIRWPPVFGK